MSKTWQVQEAKARFSELLETSLAEGASNRDETGRRGSGIGSDQPMATIGANGKTHLEATATRARTASRHPGTTAHQTTPSAGDGFRLNRCIS